MNAQAVRRGSSAKGRGRRAPARAASAPAVQRGAGRLARWAFLLFVLAIAAVAIVALDLPARIGQAAGAASGQAGFAVDGYQIVGINHMDRKLVDQVVTDELRRAGELSAGSGKPAQALISAARIREELLQYGWVKDARVSRRLPDQLVIDIVERQPAAVWQNRGQLNLIDQEGIVLAPVAVDRMPDLPLLIGPGANGRAAELGRLLDGVPTLKPQMASATWVGGRRWDLAFTSGETLMLPEGEAVAAKVLGRFVREDRRVGLLARGYRRFDLRKPGQMTVRLPEGAAEELRNLNTETPS